MAKLPTDIPHRCQCGKVLAFWRDGKLFIKCKQCKRETQVPIEPRTQEAGGH